MQTIEQIRTKLSSATGSCSKSTALRYLRKAGIDPAGSLRTRPRLYPDDAANRILTQIGYRIVSMNELRNERRRAKAPRARAAARRAA